MPAAVNHGTCWRQMSYLGSGQHSPVSSWAGSVHQTMSTARGSTLLEFASQNVRETRDQSEERALTAALVRRCVAGDGDAWERLVRQYHRRIYNICYRFT